VLLNPLVVLGDLQSQTDGTYLLPVLLLEREYIVSGNLEVGFDSGVEITKVTLVEGYSDYMVAYRAESKGLWAGLCRGAGASTRPG